MKTGLLYLSLSIVHFFMIGTSSKEEPLYLVSKVLPILILLFGLWKLTKFSDLFFRLGGFAIGFSFLGDFFLALPDPKYFVPGLGSFLIAQVCYGIAFGSKREAGLAKSIPFFLFGVVFFSVLFSNLGGLKIPVAIYTLAICFMGWKSWVIFGKKGIFLAGALVFIASDSVIAYSMFLNPDLDRKIASFAIMGTYYLAQFLLFSGFQSEFSKTQLKKT